MQRLIVSPLLWLLLGAWSCSRGDPKEAVARWLYCDECQAADLDSVKVFGSKAVGELDHVMSGPTSEEIALVTRDAIGSWFAVAREAKRSGYPLPASDSAAMVTQILRDRPARAQFRAVLALEAIGGASARASLTRFVARDTTSATGVRPDVVRRAALALTRI